MKGSLRIARFFGIPVEIHWTFVLIFVYVAYMGMAQQWAIASILWAFVFIIGLFTCVVLHEFGHALTARRFGVNTRDIILSPIGGVARLDSLPEQPLQELLVAIAGPLVNIVIATLLFPYYLSLPAYQRQQLIYSFTDPSGNFFPPDLSPASYFIVGLIALNLTLAVFNMLPAFPMDGGRVLRALLSIRWSRLIATRIASRIGQVLAILLITYGLVYAGNLMYAFIGLFVYITASGEYRMVKIEQALADHRVAEVVRRSFTRVYADDPMSEVYALYQSGGEPHFLVFDRWNNLLGILTEQAIMRGFRKNDEHSQVQDYLESRVSMVVDSDSLKKAFEVMQETRVQALPVVSPFGQITGILDAGQVDRFLKLQEKGRRK